MTAPLPNPTERLSVQDRIVLYATEIGWTAVSQPQAQQWRGFDPTGDTPRDRARTASPFFDDILYEKVRAFNPRYRQPIHELTRLLRGFSPTIQGNREVLSHLRNERTFFSTDDSRELTLQLIDYANIDNNDFHVTTEYYSFNGHFANRADVVFLINGLPVLVIECKNATKDEALAVSIDQLRRYERETPEMMLPPMLFTVTESIGFSYGVTWNITRRNIFSWKHEERGNLEGKTKTFFDCRRVLDFLQHYILFAEKDEALSKMILRQHQTTAVEKVVERATDPVKNRGLVWHTHGSGPSPSSRPPTCSTRHRRPRSQRSCC